MTIFWRPEHSADLSFKEFLFLLFENVPPLSRLKGDIIVLLCRMLLLTQCSPFYDTMPATLRLSFLGGPSLLLWPLLTGFLIATSLLSLNFVSGSLLPFTLLPFIALGNWVSQYLYFSLKWSCSLHPLQNLKCIYVFLWPQLSTILVLLTSWHSILWSHCLLTIFQLISAIASFSFLA